MALLLPHDGFKYYADSYDPAAPAYGVDITSGGSANTDGTAVTLLSALSFDVHFLQVRITDFVTNGSTARTLVDILVDPAGGSSWSEFIKDLVAGQTSVNSGLFYSFPIFIPAGTSIGAYCRSSVVSNTGTVAVLAYGEPVRPDMWWCGSGVETLGVTAASSDGTDVACGNSTMGSWVSIGGTTSHDYGSLNMGCNGGSSSMAARFWLMEAGMSDTPLPIARMILTSTTGETTSVFSPNTPFCSIPAGSQLQCRGSDSGGTVSINMALYGVY